MKTRSTLLFGMMFLTGSLLSVHAQNERSSRIVKSTTSTRINTTGNARSESRSQQKAEASRKSTEKSVSIAERARAAFESEPKTRTTEIQIERSRNRERVNTDIRIENSRDKARSNVDIRMETQQRRATNRPLNRTTQVTIRSDRPQYREFRHHCSYCTGRGFTLSFGGLRHIGCTHCNGLGYMILKELYFNTLAYSGQYTFRQLASIETDQLDAILHLSNRQWDRIYRINYRYLVRNEGRRYYPYSEKVEDIQDELNRQQLLEYAYYLDELRQDQYAFELHF